MDDNDWLIKGIQLPPPGYAFKEWHCAVKTDSSMEDEACFDTGYSILLIDEDLLDHMFPNTEIQYRSKTVQVRGIGEDTHQTVKFTQTVIRMKAVIKEMDAILSLHLELPTSEERLRAITNFKLPETLGQLEAYIRECPKCATYQTCHHKPYGDLQLILSLPNPFHTVSLTSPLHYVYPRPKMDITQQSP